jgi:hypothetical protein
MKTKKGAPQILDEHTVAEPVSKLSADEYQRLLESRVRELEIVLTKYCHCRHGSINCSCTQEARAAMFQDDDALRKERLRQLGWRP